MANTQPHPRPRLSGVRLTGEQAERLKFLAERFGSESEVIRRALDMLFDAEDTDRQSLSSARQHFERKVAELESTAYDQWPQWSGEDLLHLERILAEF